jgi:hypothetical protein
LPETVFVSLSIHDFPNEESVMNHVNLLLIFRYKQTLAGTLTIFKENKRPFADNFRKSEQKTLILIAIKNTEP